jgi:hypothetical protein
MLAPIMAIALVRCSSRARSAASAITAAAMAPLPCTTRPRMMPAMESVEDAMTLPSVNTMRPPANTGLQPKRSDSMPTGICSTACHRPYAPMASPISTGGTVLNVAVACSANAGRIMNSPSMRKEKLPASDNAALDRRH